MKNALIPPLTLAALIFVGFLTGTIIVETVFVWPGLGLLATTAVSENDFPVMTEIEKGNEDPVNNILKNSPHTVEELSSDNWKHNYSREKAAYPLDYLKARKYWPPVKRIDNVYGDKNLFCTCPNMEDF